MNILNYKEYDYIRGNTALNPNRREEEGTKRSKKPKRKVKVNKKKIISKLITKEILKIAAVFVIVGFIVLIREGQIYTIQDQLINLKADVKKATAEKEALKLQLIQEHSIEGIRQFGEDKMIIPTVNDTVQIQSEKDYFPEE